MLHRVGVSNTMIQTRIRRGELRRLRHGVYLAVSVWPSDLTSQQQILARAEVVANPNAVISHHSAALIWGIPNPVFARWEELPVTVTLPPGAGHGVVRWPAVHLVARLPVDDVARDQVGYPLTSLARTAIDLVAGMSLPPALGILDASARLICASYVPQPRRSDYSNPRLADAARSAMQEVATRLGRRAVLELIAEVDPARESVAESLSAGHFKLAGVPEPRYQMRIETPLGVFYPDCYWLEANLIGECDGAVKYRDQNALLAEKEREQALRDQGFQIVRWSAREIIGQPNLVVDRVGRALGLHR